MNKEEYLKAKKALEEECEIKKNTSQESLPTQTIP